MMNSSRPYLIRAMYEWIKDNNLTPYIVIDATQKGVQVPSEYVEEGRIVLDISADACRGLHLDNDRVLFSAKFSGIAEQIVAPPMAVLAVYAKENGRGMIFSEDDEIGGDSDGPDLPPSSGSQKDKANERSKKPSLRVVK
jgi:stringent starvation protein B